MKTIRTPLYASLGLAVILAGCASGQQPTAPPSTGAPAAMRVLQAPAADDPRQVKIHFRDRAQLNALASAGIDLFEDVDNEQKTVGAAVNAQTEPILKQMGVSYSDTIQPLSWGSFPEGYQTVEQVYADMKALAAAHPSFIQYVEFGKSRDNRPMAALRITAQRDKGLPAIRLGSGVHARELAPVEIMSRFAHTLADGYGKDKTITQLIDTKDIWIVPLQNPDGRMRVEQGKAMWRKNNRHDRRSPDGVDCNRNADNHFQQGTANPYAQDYRGPAPFSEPESQAIRDLSKQHHFDVSLDMHAFGGMVLWPPGYADTTTADEVAFRRIGGTLGQRVGYKAGTIARTIYKSYGDTATWEYDSEKTLAFAVELDCGSFAPAYREVDRQWNKWKAPLLYLVSQAGASR